MADEENTQNESPIENPDPEDSGHEVLPESGNNNGDTDELNENQMEEGQEEPDAKNDEVVAEPEIAEDEQDEQTEEMPVESPEEKTENEENPVEETQPADSNEEISGDPQETEGIPTEENQEGDPQEVAPVDGTELKSDADPTTDPEPNADETPAEDKGENEAPVDGEAETEESKAKTEGESGEEIAGETADAPLPEDTETKPEPEEEGEQASKIDTAFEEEEKPETPVIIGENLNEQEGEGAPTMEHGDLERMSVTLSPHPDEEDEYEEEEEEEEEETIIDREALIEKYKQAIQDKKVLMEQNGALQNKLAEYFRKKKADSEAGGRLESDKNFSEYEERYYKHLKTLEELRELFTNLKEQYKEEYDELKERCEEKEEKVNSERLKFIETKRQVALKAFNSRTGRSIVPKDLDAALANEQKKELDVVNARLENIKLMNKLKKEEMALKSKEELSEGLHLIDFEQLKIENQTYNEKIEERQEELLKLRKKITSTVQVLTHLKEKLQFVQQENHSQNVSLAEVDAQLSQKRDILSKTKKSRDTHRLDNMQLRQNCGLLGNDMLLRDMEECVDKVSDRKNALRMMEKEHVELSLRKNGIQHKIEQSRSADPLIRQ